MAETPYIPSATTGESFRTLSGEEQPVCDGCGAIGWAHFIDNYSHDNSWVCTDCGLSVEFPSLQRVELPKYTSVADFGTDVAAALEHELFNVPFFDENGCETAPAIATADFSLVNGEDNGRSFWDSFQEAISIRNSWTREEAIKHYQSLYDKKFKGSYSRRAHITERLYCHCLAEPKICPEDLDQIRRTFEKTFLTSSPFNKERFEKGKLDKKDVQTILRLIDHKVKKNGEKGYFCRRYLEKWRSILAFLNDEEPNEVPTYTADELSLVGQAMLAFSNLWDMWQPPQHKYDRKTWKFPERKHFPNYSYMFRKVHGLLGISHYDKYFPVPKNPTENLDKYYNAMCKWLGIPLEEKKELKQATLKFQ